MKRIAVVLLLLVIVGAGGAAGAAWWFVNTPVSSSTAEVIVDIPKGAGSHAIAEQLVEQGLVRNAVAFRYYVKFRKAGSALRAGEFRFRRDLTPSQVLETILKGDVVLHKITVPEGLAAKDISTLVEASGLGSGAEFLRLTDDAVFARSLGVPADRLEGYLYPDTYAFEKGAGARTIAATMVKHFQQVWTPEIAAKAKALGLDEHRAVTLASIVEKETGVPEERAIIAGVFYNRLTKGMKLESDPTIIYGMKEYRGNIHKADIHDPANVYNTYVIKGLPPGPIASPGGDALRAVAEPAKHDWIFFVANGEGRHVFAATLQEHVRNVERYQLRHATPKKSRPG